MGLFDIFKKKKERSMLDELESITISGFRKLGELNGIPPTKRTSDEDILRIYREIVNAYREVEGERNEIIPAKCLNAITLHFLQVYEVQGQDFYEKHLEYELNKYINEGLRDYQKEGVNLF